MFPLFVLVFKNSKWNPFLMGFCLHYRLDRALVPDSFDFKTFKKFENINFLFLKVLEILETSWPRTKSGAAIQCKQPYAALVTILCYGKTSFEAT